MIDKIEAISKELDDKSIKYSQLSWTQYTTGFDFGMDEAYKEMTEILKKKENFEAAKEALEINKEGDDARKSQLFYKGIEDYHLSEELNALKDKINKKTTELSQILNTHRVIFEGKETTSLELSKILSEEEDRERRKAAFYARNQVNAPLVEGGFLELIKMRNESARLAGKNDFTEWALHKTEMDPEVFSGWKEQLHEVLPAMNELNLKYARLYLDDDTIYPWDLAYIRSKIAPVLNRELDMSSFFSVLREFFLTFDVDISKFNVTYDVFPRKNKSEWGYQFTIEQGRDCRILANVLNRYSDYGVLLHETGHSVHSFMLDPEEKLLNTGISGIISEGIANLFGNFLYDEIFYKQFFSPEEAEESMNQLKEMEKLIALKSINRILFDQELYKRELNSLEDINNLYREMYQDFFQEMPFDMDPPWAMLIHHTTHPIYLHNYFMGDVTCEMLKKVFNTKHGTTSITEKPFEFKDFLYNEVIKPSGRYTFAELFKRIAGDDFSLKYIL